MNPFHYLYIHSNNSLCYSCIHLIIHVSINHSLFNWTQFLKERAPPAVFLLLAAGPCLTGLQMVEGKIDWEKFIWAVFGELVSTFIIIKTLSNMLCPKVLLLTVRIMDDVKDYELDLVVHPDRLVIDTSIIYILSVLDLYLGVLSSMMKL